MYLLGINMFKLECNNRVTAPKVKVTHKGQMLKVYIPCTAYNLNCNFAQTIANACMRQCAERNNLVTTPRSRSHLKVKS